MDIVGIKVISGILFFLLVVVLGWLPFCFYHWVSSAKYRKYTMLGHVSNNNNNDKKKNEKNFTQYLHYFASGVLIATCLLHLLPESLEAVEKGLNAMSKSSPISFRGQEKDLLIDAKNCSGPGGGLTGDEDDAKNMEKEQTFYPIAELLVALGFISIYIIESTIKSIQERNIFEKGNRTLTSILSREQHYDGEGNPENHKTRANHLVSQNSTNTNFMRLRDYSSQFLPNSSLFPHSNATIESTSLSRDCNHKDDDCGDMELEEMGLQADGAGSDEEEDHHSPLTTDQSDSTDVKSMALVMALCIHGFFDGLMLGLQSKVSVIYSLLFALSVHKIFVAISMSLTLAKNYTALRDSMPDRIVPRYRYLLYVLLFASVGPLGIIASAGFVHSNFMTSQPNDVSMVPGCLQSFAVGTFLYVTFTETASHHGRQGTLCSELQGHLSLLAGFTLMACLRVVFGET